MAVTAIDELQIASRERLRDRLAAHVNRRRLDAALASGIPPETNAELALRARSLTNIWLRRELARTIRRLIRDAGALAPPSRARTSPLSGRVTAAAGALSELADKLAEPKPVSSRGVAQALVLLTDGTGPLFNPQNYGSVRNRAVAAIANLTIDVP